MKADAGRCAAQTPPRRGAQEKNDEINDEGATFPHYPTNQESGIIFLGIARR
jgi:hypothetical protein